MNPPEQHRDPNPRRCQPYADDLTTFASFNETVRRMFENLFHGLERQYRQLGTNWGSLTPSSPDFRCNFGSSVGQIVNDAEKFAVEVDVSLFYPEDLKVSLRHDVLTIEGHQKQQRDQHGTIERHFIRRYTLPDDVDDKTLVSHISDNGILTVKARKKNIPPITPTRTIPIQAHGGRQDSSRSSSQRDSSRSQTARSH